MVRAGKSRALTTGEIAALPRGLVAAIDFKGVELAGLHHPLSRVSKVLRGYAVILVRDKRIFWPGLPSDLSSDPVMMSVLGHELVHVWQYAGGMTLVSYVWRDVICRFGRYSYRLEPGKPYAAYGYEQQAAMVEDWMRLKAGQALRWGATGTKARALETVVPFL